MTSRLRNFVAGLASAATLLLAACGGGGGGGGGSAVVPAVTPPTAIARADVASAAIGTTVTLDGSTSTTPNGTTLTYLWALVSKPDGSATALSATTGARPTLVPDRPGAYVADLMVNDGRADSAHVRFTVTATSEIPLAVVAPVPAVLLGTSVVLDGSGSLPPTGGAASDLRYEWKLAEQPTGTPTTVLNNTTTAKPGFIAEKAGIYRVTLVVSHGGKASAQVETSVAVNTSNSAPVIQATVAATAVRGAAVALDASGSRDPDGDKLGYRWAFSTTVSPAIPRASGATIRNAGTARAEFTADAAGPYNVTLTVYDGSVATSQNFAVQVGKPAGAANTAPVAAISSVEYEVGAFATPGGSVSYDLDGDALTYQWTWWNTATPGTRQTATGSSLNLGRALPAGTYQAELVVNDGQVDSTVASRAIVIKIGANAAPVASAKVDVAKVLVGQTITFNGSGSTDRNSDPLSYQWTLVDRPDGSNAVLQNATGVQATVVADQPGIYTARLQVSDPAGAASGLSTANIVSAFAKARNNPPVIAKLWTQGYGDTDVLPNQPWAIQDNGTGTAPMPLAFQAFDPDQDAPLYYLATPTRQPAGSTLAAASGQMSSGATQSIPNTVTLPGEYEFQVLVSDGVGSSEPKSASVTVVPRQDYPGALMEWGSGVVSDPANFGSAGQQFWPHRFIYAAGHTNGPEGTPREVRVYRIYAGDRDYTVTGLQATSTDATLQPYWVGLQNGQVIPKGQSVVFALYRPAIPNELAQFRHLYSDLGATYGFDSSEFKDELARLTTLFGDYRFTWSFRLAEKEGYTFYVGPSN